MNNPTIDDEVLLELIKKIILSERGGYQGATTDVIHQKLSQGIKITLEHVIVFLQYAEQEGVLVSVGQLYCVLEEENS